LISQLYVLYVEMWRKVKEFFSERYNTTIPQVNTVEYKDERIKCFALAEDELKIIGESAKFLEIALAKFRKGLEAFQQKKEIILAQQKNFIVELEALDKETDTNEANEQEEKKEQNIVEDKYEIGKTEAKSRAVSTKREKEKQLRLYLFHALYTDIPRTITTIETSINQYLDKILELENKKAEITQKKRDVEMIIAHSVETPTEGGRLPSGDQYKEGIQMSDMEGGEVHLPNDMLHRQSFSSEPLLPSPTSSPKLLKNETL